jgi:hypothetical protein
VPESIKTDELIDLIEWLGELVRQVDSSLLDEWEQLTNPTDDEEPGAVIDAPANRVTANTRAFRVLVRNAMFRRVELAALERYEELGELDPEFGADAWAEAMEAYYAEHDELGTGPDARGPKLMMIEEVPDEALWRVRQTFDDPAGDRDWGISAEVDLTASDEEGTAVVRVLSVDRL